MSDEDNTPRGWTPLASGRLYVAIGSLISLVGLWRGSSLKDAKPADIGKEFDALRTHATETRDSVRMQIPQSWSFATFVHSPRLVTHPSIPGLERVPVGPSSKVIASAFRSPGYCAAILERDRSRSANLDEDMATLAQTVARNAYERNIFDWIVHDRSYRWKFLLNTADELLNEAPPGKTTIAFKQVQDFSAPLGRLQGRKLAFAADLDGREGVGVTFAVARKDQWQYTLIGAIGEPILQCEIESTWIEHQLSIK